MSLARFGHIALWLAELFVLLLISFLEACLFFGVRDFFRSTSNHHCLEITPAVALFYQTADLRIALDIQGLLTPAPTSRVDQAVHVDKPERRAVGVAVLVNSCENQRVALVEKVVDFVLV